MTPAELAAIRERADAIDLGEPASLISALAVDAHKDRAALLDHVETLTKRLEAVRELHTKHTDPRELQWCHHCETPWPCPTIRAIEGDPDA